MSAVEKEATSKSKSKPTGERGRGKPAKTAWNTPQVDPDTVPSISGEEDKVVTVAEVALPTTEEVKTNLEIDPNGVLSSNTDDPDVFGKRIGEQILQNIIAEADVMAKNGTFPFRPQVYINGRVIEPVGTHTPTDRFLPFGNSALIESYPYVPVAIAELISGKQFNIYKVRAYGAAITILADAESSLVLDEGSYSPDNYGYPPTTKGASVLLINARSLEDFFIGNVVLMNTNSERNIYNSSSVSMIPKKENLPYSPPWEFSAKEEESAITRLQIKGSKMRDSTVRNSSLENATLFESEIEDSTLRGQSLFIEGSSLRECQVTAGGPASFNHASLDKVSLLDKSDVLVHNARMKAVYLSGKGDIYHSNKFDLTEIQVPGQNDVKLIRESRTLFSLYDPGHCKSFPIKITDGDYEIQKTVAALLRLDDDNPYNQDDFTSSVMRYITNTIVSRLKLISTLNAAEKTTSILNGHYKRYRSVFE